MSKIWHLNVENWYGGDRIQNITQTLELFEAAGENNSDDVAVESFSFQIHEGTQQVPRNTVTVANTTYAHNNQKFWHSLFPPFFSTRRSRKKKNFNGFPSL